MRQAIIGWIRLNCARSKNVCFVCIYGSFARGTSKFNDVDVVLIFNEWNVRLWAARAEGSFERRFHRPLHIQKFHRSQKRSIQTFMDKLNEGRNLKWV
jgi:predicted nucleotidyltransferase